MLKQIFIFLVFAMTALCGCTDQTTPITPSPSEIEAERIIETTLPGSYDWVESYSTKGDPNDSRITPNTENYKQSLIVTKTIFTVRRDGLTTQNFPFVTLRGSEDEPGSYRVHDLDLGRIRYSAQPSSQEVFLTDYFGRDQMVHRYRRR